MTGIYSRVIMKKGEIMDKWDKRFYSTKWSLKRFRSKKKLKADFFSPLPHRQTARYGININGATLYCTHQPCVICAKMIINAGIKRVVYKEGYPDEFSMKLFAEARTEVEKYFCSVTGLSRKSVLVSAISSTVSIPAITFPNAAYCPNFSS